MITIKEIKEKDHELCYELDSHTISLWSKKQWANEFRKEGTKVFGLNLSNVLIAICVIQFVADEAHLNYLSVNYKFQRQGFGSNLMSYVNRKRYLILIITRFKSCYLNYLSQFYFQ